LLDYVTGLKSTKITDIREVLKLTHFDAMPTTTTKASTTTAKTTTTTTTTTTATKPLQALTKNKLRDYVGSSTR